MERSRRDIKTIDRPRLDQHTSEAHLAPRRESCPTARRRESRVPPPASQTLGPFTSENEGNRASVRRGARSYQTETEVGEASRSRFRFEWELGLGLETGVGL
ncbi:hypothetical protein BDV93DRAFT_50871 [Ceratobasidium sp. AG-I]|nr:hypothetical protein BDV93DRAFT_50871 [Ceratobasidium sp. AG-I]